MTWWKAVLLILAGVGLAAAAAVIVYIILAREAVKDMHISD